MIGVREIRGDRIAMDTDRDEEMIVYCCNFVFKMVLFFRVVVFKGGWFCFSGILGDVWGYRWLSYCGGSFCMSGWVGIRDVV